MILRCYFLMGLILIGDLSVVRCADSSAVAENSAFTEMQETTTESADFTNTGPPNTDEDTTTDVDGTEETTTSYNESKEYSSSPSSQEENSAQHTEFLLVSSEKEIPTTEPSDLEPPSLNYDNSTEEQAKDLPPSTIFTTLVNLEEDRNMSFENLASIFLEENKDSNLNKSRRRKERNQAPEIIAELEDDLVETEFVKQEVKHKSLGIEPLALIVLPEKHTRTTPKATTTITVSWKKQYERTSYLLTSDTEIDQSPFVVKSKSSKQLELQEDLSNITHEAASLKKSPESVVYLLPPLTVEIDRDSNLLLNANERQEIAFEVSNNLNNAARVTFTVRDELGILLEIDRYIAILGPHASTTVKVAVLPKSGQSSDRITFIATGSEQIRKEVIVDIESNHQSDTDIPFVDYNYLSDCTEIVLSKCKEGTWTIKISAKDTESGLKLLSTTPKGLYFPEGYTAGTREEVTGIYSESCCNADLEIVAIDRMNNRYVRQINAYRAPLSFWAVTAITLVSLIFLTIIVVSSLICLKKCKKNEADSFDLPTYRGGRSRY